MVVNPIEGKRLTAQDIAAENARLAKLMGTGDSAPRGIIRSTTTPDQLKAKLRNFKTYPAPDVPAVVDVEKPHCPDCNGLGQIKYDLPVGHPLFGKLVKCPNPNCPGVQQIQEKRVVTTGEIIARHFGKIEEHYPRASFSQYPEKDNRKAVRAARAWMEKRVIPWGDQAKNSLVFYGKAGTGKTHLVSAMYNGLPALQPALFLKMLTMLKGVQRGYSEGSELRDYEVEDLLCTMPLLFIDELETNLKSGDRTDILESVIDYRCRENMPTIVTTNLEQHEVRNVWNNRIESRLVHMAWWIEMGGATLRDNSGPFEEDS